MFNKRGKGLILGHDPGEQRSKREGRQDFSALFAVLLIAKFAALLDIQPEVRTGDIVGIAAHRHPQHRRARDANTSYRTDLGEPLRKRTGECSPS